jgi:hypothetical protein
MKDVKAFFKGGKNENRLGNRLLVFYRGIWKPGRVVSRTSKNSITKKKPGALPAFRLSTTIFYLPHFMIFARKVKHSNANLLTRSSQNDPDVVFRKIPKILLIS